MLLKGIQRSDKLTLNLSFPTFFTLLCHSLLSSDKVALPSHPVIFTKRASSIIAHGQSVYLDEEFTSTLDYEGEIGVIIGKGGYKISEADAKEHIWGYTIINDLTARERQRDHKQFYIGKHKFLEVPSCSPVYAC